MEPATVKNELFKTLDALAKVLKTFDSRIKSLEATMKEFNDRLEDVEDEHDI